MDIITWATQFVVSGISYTISTLWKVVDSIGAYGMIISVVTSVIVFRFFIKPMFGGSDMARPKQKVATASNGNGSNNKGD